MSNNTALQLGYLSCLSLCCAPPCLVVLLFYTQLLLFNFSHTVASIVQVFEWSFFSFYVMFRCSIRRKVEELLRLTCALIARFDQLNKYFSFLFDMSVTIFWCFKTNSILHMYIRSIEISPSLP